MRHYEIIFLVHPDQSAQVQAMIERYKTIVKESSGKIHRLENWGRRQLAYSIKKIHKAHYVLMNVECSKSTLVELESNFRFNDAVLRSMTITKQHAVSEVSFIAAANAEEAKLAAEKLSQAKAQKEIDKKAAKTASATVDQQASETAATVAVPSEDTPPVAAEAAAISAPADPAVEDTPTDTTTQATADATPDNEPSEPASDAPPTNTESIDSPTDTADQKSDDT